MTLRRIAHADLDAYLRWQAGVLRSVERSDGVGPTGWGEVRGRLGTGTVTSRGGLGSGVPSWNGGASIEVPHGPGGVPGWGHRTVPPLSGALADSVPCFTGIRWGAILQITSAPSGLIRGGFPFQNGRMIAVTEDGTAYAVVVEGVVIQLYQLVGLSFQLVLEVGGLDVGIGPAQASVCAAGSTLAIVWATETADPSSSNNPREAQIRAVVVAHPVSAFISPTVERVSDAASYAADGMGPGFANAGASATFDALGDLWVGWSGTFANALYDGFVARRSATGTWYRVVPSHTLAENADRGVRWVAIAAHEDGVICAMNYAGTTSDNVATRDVYSASLVAGVPPAAGPEVWIAGSFQGTGSYPSTVGAEGPAFDASAAAGPDRAYIGWHQIPNRDGTGHPLPWWSRSSSAGAWSGQDTIVSSTLYDRSKFVHLAAHPTRGGRVAAAWEDRSNGLTDPHTIRTAVWCRGTWAEVSNPAGASAGSGYPSMLIEGEDRVHLAWLDESTTPATVWYVQGSLT